MPKLKTRHFDDPSSENVPFCVLKPFKSNFTYNNLY
eukprot:UN22737